MKKLLLNRWALGLCGVLLLALVIWFLGPFFAFGEARPLLSVSDPPHLDLLHLPEHLHLQPVPALREAEGRAPEWRHTKSKPAGFQAPCIYSMASAASVKFPVTMPLPLVLMWVVMGKA